MANVKASPYVSAAAHALIDELTGGKTEYTTNTFYQSPADPRLFWYVNNRGFYHICRLSAVRYGGSIAWYEITDDAITKDGTIKKNVKTHGMFASKSAAMDALHNKAVTLI